MKYVVTYCGEGVGATSDEDFEQHLDDITNALVEIEEGDPLLSDADVSATITERLAEFSITVDCADLNDAALRGLSAIRAAIHAANGHTPGWENNAVAEITFRGMSMHEVELTPA